MSEMPVKESAEEKKKPNPTEVVSFSSLVGHLSQSENNTRNEWHEF
jgi:hypothetical protein